MVAASVLGGLFPVAGVVEPQTGLLGAEDACEVGACLLVLDFAECAGFFALTLVVFGEVGLAGPSGLTGSGASGAVAGAG